MRLSSILPAWFTGVLTLTLLVLSLCFWFTVMLPGVLVRCIPVPRGQRLASRFCLELERVGNRTENVPTFSFLVRATLRWLSPHFHPIHEGDTQQALDYLARSPAARAAAMSEAR